MDREELFYSMLKEQSDSIHKMRENIHKMQSDLQIHIHKAEIAEEEIEALKSRELSCPGRKVSEWNTGLMNRIKDGAIVVGLLITLLKLFNIIP
jgi:hypothetical protein